MSSTRTSIKKIDVMPGVYWVEVPAAGLKILCGAPADSVKHLMRLGLIYSEEINGVKCESGPNAILLSDSALQNGTFSNMAEFPVLQMLYKQGMIIPNHPNNTGAKPLLIGSKEQLKAQLDYIFRGNYGLVSEEEIMKAGVNEFNAKEMMRMKLRFAFGSIRSSNALIDTVEVGEGHVLIRNGAWIERLSHNHFAIGYEDELVEVELTLGSSDRYPPPYQLGYYQITRDYFGVVHSGQGDGWDVNRPSMSSILTYQGKIYLIDAGPNIDHILTSLGIGISEIEGIFHTHGHDDHFAGITTLMRSDHKLKYFAVPAVRASVAKKIGALLSMPEEAFNDFFEIVDLKLEEYNDIQGLEVMPVFSPHPVETTIFFFRTLWEKGYKSYGHFADTVSLKVLASMIEPDASKPGVSSETLERVKELYLMPLDIKKLDVGGGMIHGEAEDYRRDKSTRLILAHTSKELSTGQKEIGSGASFGTIDTLIPAKQIYERRYAYDFLKAYFNTPDYELRVILNCDIVCFNPETILIKESETDNDIFLILTGIVELIPPKGRRVIMMSAGSLVGEVSGLVGLPCGETYRAASFVQALRIPPGLYLAFVQKNRLYDDIEALKENRSYLERTWLFGEEISCLVQNKIVEYMGLEKRRAGTVETIEGGKQLYLIINGVARIEYNDDTYVELGEGDFYGESVSDTDIHKEIKLVYLTDTRVLCVPCDALRDIPIVRLKILETNQKRLIRVAKQVKE